MNCGDHLWQHLATAFYILLLIYTASAAAAAAAVAAAAAAATVSANYLRCQWFGSGLSEIITTVTF